MWRCPLARLGYCCNSKSQAPDQQPSSKVPEHELGATFYREMTPSIASCGIDLHPPGVEAEASCLVLVSGKSLLLRDNFAADLSLLARSMVDDAVSASAQLITQTVLITYHQPLEAREQSTRYVVGANLTTPSISKGTPVDNQP